MECIFIHGMAQWGFDWDEVITSIRKTATLDAEAIDLWPLLADQEATYQNLYQGFVQHLETLDMKPPYKLCGMSLGGRLALNYAIDYPDNVHSLMAIGVHPKTLSSQLWRQKIMFKVTPKAAFARTGLSKAQTMSLCASLAKVDLREKVKNITCPAAILYGEKDDKHIQASAQYLADNIPHATLGSVANAGHLVHLENPQGLAEKVVAFFQL